MTRSRLIASCLMAALLLLAYALLRSRDRMGTQPLVLADMPVEPVKGTKWVQTTTLSELNGVGTFTGKVKSKEMGQDLSSKPHDTNRVEFLTIWLLLHGGKELVIRQESPDANAKTFYHYLKPGEQYEFPMVWDHWNKRPNR
jgi:hypothetical protein